MELWTVQPMSVLSAMENDGRVLVDPFQVNEDGYISESYRWLVWQMSFRIDNSHGWLPWFAYCSRPDLRVIRHLLSPGEHCLITFQPPQSQVLVFPTWAWCKVFSGQYLAVSRNDELEWKKRFRKATGLSIDDVNYHEIVMNFSPEWKTEIDLSCLRLFDSNLPTRSWEHRNASDHREAVVEQLRLEWVRDVKTFQSTKS